MGMKCETTKVMKWCLESNKMITATEVWAVVETNEGTVLFEEGPLYATTGGEVFQACQLLKERLTKRLTTQT